MQVGRTWQERVPTSVPSQGGADRAGTHADAVSAKAAKDSPMLPRPMVLFSGSVAVGGDTDGNIRQPPRNCVTNFDEVESSLRLMSWKPVFDLALGFQYRSYCAG